jgi:glycosyltransferase involved in cell wall biosynthesis
VRSLVVAPEPPLPATSGLRLRTLHLARQLATIAEVDVVALGEAPRIEERFTLVGIPHTRGKLQSALTSFRRPYLAARVRSRRMDDWIRARGWDTVQAEFPFTVASALHADAPVVLDAHNVEGDVVRGFHAAEQRVLPRMRWRWEAAKTNRLERAAVARVDAVCATSSGDAEKLEALGARRVVVVPNGVDTESIEFTEREPSRTLLYVGDFRYRPNVAAARELADDVFPQVRRAVPDATLILVGRDAPPLFRAPGVEVHSSVPDVLPFLRRAAAVVVPVRVGSGTRLKVLEALAAGVTVVSTRFGVAGLELQPEREFLVGETADELAEQSVRLLRDDALALRIARAGRAVAEAKYDWRVVARPLLDLHRELARA